MSLQDSEEVTGYRGSLVRQICTHDLHEGYYKQTPATAVTRKHFIMANLCSQSAHILDMCPVPPFHFRPPWSVK